MTDKEFFDAPSPLGDRETRREAINDYADNIEVEIANLKDAVETDDLESVRRRFAEAKAWFDALDDNICERDEDGSRKDGGQ
jgi:hypothetical protein